MDIAEALRFIQDNNRGILVTYRKDGLPQMSPIVCAVGDGTLEISSRETAMKTHNVRRDPRVSLCVFTENFFGQWVQVDGSAEVISLPDAMEPLVDYYRTLSGEHPDWDDYRKAMEEENRVIIRITPDRAGPDVSG